MLGHKVLLAFATLLVSSQAAPLAQAGSSAINPASCLMSYSTPFSFMVVQAPQQNSKRQVAQIPDGQVQASSAQPAASAQQAVPTQINDGQVQAQQAIPPPQVTQPVASQINDGQVQAQQAVTPVPIPATVPAVSQIHDGQVQAPAATGPAVSQINDGQVQAPNGTPAAQISDGQVQNNNGVSQSSDGQVQGSSGASSPSGSGVVLQSCTFPGALTLTLDNGSLKDSQGRVAYIAANNQFQFDNPPQSDALSIGGYAICNGMLTLNENPLFYQCLSGDFYNLYDAPIAPYCEPVNFQVVNLVQC